MGIKTNTEKEWERQVETERAIERYKDRQIENERDEKGKRIKKRFYHKIEWP